MKHRAMAFAFTAVLVSSLAFADNPTDAPLVTDYAITPVVQQEVQASHKPKRSKKKDESSSAKAKTENPQRATVNRDRAILKTPPRRPASLVTTNQPER